MESSTFYTISIIILVTTTVMSDKIYFREGKVSNVRESAAQVLWIIIISTHRLLVLQLSTDWIIDKITDWMTDQITDWITDQITEWPTKLLTERLTKLLTELLIDWPNYWWNYRLNYWPNFIIIILLLEEFIVSPIRDNTHKYIMYTCKHK